MRDKVACDARVSPRRQRHPSLRIKAAFDDVVESALQWQQWLTLGNLDIRLRFRRTALGPFWTTLSFSLLAAALGSVYAHVLGEGVRTYLPYVVCGLFVWVFIAATLQETTDCFVNYAYILKQVYVPRMTIVYRVLWRNILLLAFNIPTVVAVLLLCQVQLTWSLPLTFVGFALLALNLLWVSTLLALAAARHPLVSRLVQAMLPLAMFVTPLIWRPLTPDLRGLAQMNPLYYAVDLVRGPLLGQTPHPSVRFPLHGSRGPSGTVPNSPLGGLIGRARRGPSYVDALNDVSLRLRGGDRLGIIGHNGSGKSTLLRVIGSIYEPWRGTVEVSGRVLSLADPMLGMNHECTGRENVVLRGIFMV